jgi:hypothetical protein
VPDPQTVMAMDLIRLERLARGYWHRVQDWFRRLRKLRPQTG